MLISFLQPILFCSIKCKKRVSHAVSGEQHESTKSPECFSIRTYSFQWAQKRYLPILNLRNENKIKIKYVH